MDPFRYPSSIVRTLESAGVFFAYMVLACKFTHTEAFKYRRSLMNHSLYPTHSENITM